jgi:predicted ester cyclase
MSANVNKELISRGFEEYNAINGDSTRAMAWVDRHYTPDSITHAPASGDMNFEQIKQYHASQVSALNPHYALKSLIAEGDMVAVQFTLNLTHQGAFMGLPPTGKKFQCEGVMVMKNKGSKMQEVWFYMDMLNFMRQLGAIPNPAAAVK